MLRIISALFLLCPIYIGTASAQAITCGLADDTPAAQAAINATRQLILPAGTCRISSINATNLPGVSITGAGNLITQIIPIQSGVNVIDLTGSTTKTLHDFRICGFCDLSVVPLTGILDAQASGYYTSDVTIIDRIRVDGKFSIAAFYNLQVASSAISHSQLYNYQPGAKTVVMTGNNLIGATSGFVSINQANNFASSDWTFTQVEIHNFGNAPALWMGGMNSFRMYGGNISSSAIPVSYNAVMIAGAVAYPDYNIFDGVTFYNDFAPTPACAIQNNAGAAHAPILRANQHNFPLVC